MSKSNNEKFRYPTGEKIVVEHIPDWMYRILGLHGVEKELFALIFSFTMDNKVYSMTQVKASNTIGASTKTIGRALSSLCEKGFIHKEKPIRGYGYRDIPLYRANIDKIKEMGAPIEWVD